MNFQIAPVIHEWTYDAMCHDLLNMEGNKYVHEVSSVVKILHGIEYILFIFISVRHTKRLHIQLPSKTGGPPEKKEVLLEDHDPVWLELRHAHIADVCPVVIPFCFLITFHMDVN